MDTNEREIPMEEKLTLYIMSFIQAGWEHSFWIYATDIEAAWLCAVESFTRAGVVIPQNTQMRACPEGFRMGKRELKGKI
jgi:hypothetical protein